MYGLEKLKKKTLSLPLINKITAAKQNALKLWQKNQLGKDFGLISRAETGKAANDMHQLPTTP